MQPVAEALPGLAAVALLVTATAVMYASRLALLGRAPGAERSFVRGWWRWLRGAEPQPPGPGCARVVPLRHARRARRGAEPFRFTRS